MQVRRRGSTPSLTRSGRPSSQRGRASPPGRRREGPRRRPHEVVDEARIDHVVHLRCRVWGAAAGASAGRRGRMRVHLPRRSVCRDARGNGITRCGRPGRPGGAGASSAAVQRRLNLVARAQERGDHRLLVFVEACGRHGDRDGSHAAVDIGDSDSDGADAGRCSSLSKASPVALTSCSSAMSCSSEMTLLRAGISSFLGRWRFSSPAELREKRLPVGGAVRREPRADAGDSHEHTKRSGFER